MSAKYPQPIKPELIEIGDKIEVVLREVDGMSQTRRGTITAINVNGSLRYLMVGESTILAVYEPGKKAEVKFIIHSRKPVEQSPMFDMDFDVAMAEVRKRVA